MAAGIGIDGIDIDRLYFGSDDAERDEKNGLLIKAFIETPFYKRVLSQRRELVTGRKGSGKSAICLKLKNLLIQDGYKVSLITPDALSRQKIEKIGADSITKEEIYLLTWRYIFLVKTAMAFLDLVKNLKIPHLRYDSQQVKQMREFLGENGEIEAGFGQNLTSLASVINKIKINVFGVGGEIEKKSSGSTQKDLADLIPRFEEKLALGLSYLSDDVSPIFLLVDKVDEIWTENEESQLMISGMLRAVHQFNEKFKDVSVIAFLRSDIFDTLKFHDIDKTVCQEERLRWGPNDIKELLGRRAYISIIGAEDTEKSTENFASMLDLIFPEKVEGEDPVDYILGRTLMRPREAIQFCNSSLNIAQDKHQKFILAEDILEAESQYSAWKLRDLVSEFQIQYPYLEFLIPMFDGFKSYFTRDEFSYRYQESKILLKEKYPDLNSYSDSTILKELYEIGFLGIASDITQVGNALYQYSRKKLGDNLTLSFSSLFTVHPTYHLALELTADSNISIHQTISGDMNVVGDIIISGSKASVNQVILDLDILEENLTTNNNDNESN